MKRFLRRVFFLLVTAAVAVAFYYAYQPQPIQADFETVARGPMQVTLDEEGETRIHDRFVVSAPLAGRVLRIDLEPGDSVRAGRTTIATFLPIEPALLDVRSRAEAESGVRLAEAALRTAEATRDRVREELNFAESQLERYAELMEQELISRERFDTAEFEARRTREALNAADFQVRDAEQAVELAETALIQAGADSRASNGAGQPITIRSPIDGVVLRRLRESEAVVPSGEALVEIGDTEQLEIVSDFLSADAVRISNGARVLIEQWGGGITLEGRVRLVEPSGFTKLSALGVEEQRVNVVIDFDDVEQAAEYLGDAYRVEVRVITWESEDTLKAPTSSLFRDDDGNWAVFTLSEGKALQRKVEIGQRNGLEAQVLSGLDEDEPVIVHPSDDIADGVEVVPRG